MLDMKCPTRGFALATWFAMVTYTDSISVIGPTCFRCDREVLPTTCSSVVTCGPHEICAIEKGVDFLNNDVFWSGCKDKRDCASNKRRNSPDDVTVTCSTCCDGNLCNSEGCGKAGFPQGGLHVCFNCANMTSSSNCSRVAMCQKDEVCYFEEVPHKHSVVYRSGCRNLPDCKTSRSCGGCCLGNFCNSGCNPYDNLKPPYQYVTLTNPSGLAWITIPPQQ
ncbi:uncharacterized protein LOC133175475 [Saccostrea echinata]|uniref:uncharacterized protein LOC133175475 n=1 Tax=Saccostrea echinata TaxID=191078 RepID=UPI002A802598|nr:uncharacterized protein LOC133175475 [Saccostrea echinata]